MLGCLTPASYFLAPEDQVLFSVQGNASGRQAMTEPSIRLGELAFACYLFEAMTGYDESFTSSATKWAMSLTCATRRAGEPSFIGSIIGAVGI